MSSSLSNTKRKTRKPKSITSAAATVITTSTPVVSNATIPEHPPVPEVSIPAVVVEESVPTQTQLEPEPVPEVSIPEVVVEEPVPQVIFIVPYRDREAHYRLFSAQMERVLASAPPHKILYIHQTDNRGFNRGAMKNIGFLVVKEMYPNDYQNITLIFNDVDSVLSRAGLIPYSVPRGTVNHYYGFTHTLGGIVGFNAADFERINGFPNFWTWGYEDNLLQIRAQEAGYKIVRKPFYPVNDPNIIRMLESNMRTVNRTEFDRFSNKTREGIRNIGGLKYEYNPATGFVDVLEFETGIEEQINMRKEHDLKNGSAPFMMGRRRARIPMQLL